MTQEIEKYRKPTRILHWVHTGAFIALFLTGLILFIPGLGFLAEDGWTRVIHRVAAVVFIVVPLIRLFADWKGSWQGVKDAFTWSSEDMGWLKAAPRYYFLNDDKEMPPQDHMNTGQKLWWFLVIVFGVVFVLTGLVMWFLKEAAPAGLLQWMVFIHDVAFIVTGAMFFVHVYMAFHPNMGPLRTGSWNSMTHGTVSVEYAKSHHGKWYQRVTRGG